MIGRIAALEQVFALFSLRGSITSRPCDTGLISRKFTQIVEQNPSFEFGETMALLRWASCTYTRTRPSSNDSFLRAEDLMAACTSSGQPG